MSARIKKFANLHNYILKLMFLTSKLASGTICSVEYFSKETLECVHVNLIDTSVTTVERLNMKQCKSNQIKSSLYSP